MSRGADSGYTETQVVRGYCSASLLNFTRHFFRVTRNSGFIVNGHHQRICEALEDVIEGRTTRLIINMPPRYGKSLLVVINFIAYCFSRNPACEFIHLSKSDTLITTNARQILEIMNTAEYRRLFPEVRLTRTSHNTIETTALGKLYCAPFDGQILGHGAGKVDRPDGVWDGFNGAIIIDDPHKAQDMFSEAARTASLQRFQDTIRTRCNSYRTPIIIIMQRLYMDDLCGYLIENEGRVEEGGQWKVLSLPALSVDADGNEVALWPGKHTVEQLHELRRNMGEWNFDTQFMQNPAPIEGLLFPSTETKYYDRLPDSPDYILCQVDPADEGKDCTCSAIYLVRDGLVYVADVIYTPDNADVTVPLIVEQIKRFGPSRVNVESNAAWRLYVREVRNRVAEAGLTCDVVRVNQHVNKEVRIFNQYPSVRSSFLYARKDSQSPEYARYMSDKHRYMKMVRDQRDDGVDTDAAACEFLKKSGIIPIV